MKFNHYLLVSVTTFTFYVGGLFLIKKTNTLSNEKNNLIHEKFNI